MIYYTFSEMMDDNARPLLRIERSALWESLMKDLLILIMMEKKIR